MKNPDYPRNSPDEFMGYCIDMLKELQDEIGFKTKISLVKDGVYGSLDPETKKWNGMIRELIDQVEHFWIYLKLYVIITYLNSVKIVCLLRDILPQDVHYFESLVLFTNQYFPDAPDVHTILIQKQF